MRRRFLAASLGLAALLVLAAAITFTHGWGFLFKPAPGAAHDYLPIREMLEDLRACGIYSVARIVVFRDPVLAQKRPALMVRTKSGRPVAGGVWVNPASREVWDYNVALAREAYALGFDEVQFDYIRFPEGSGAESAVYPGMGDRQRTDVIAAFTRYAREQLGWEKRLSAAVFGFMGVAVDDQRIGQRPERMAPYLDYISPMAYPSHYSPGNYGFANPNAHPYEVVAGTLDDFARLITTSGCRLRPWLQAFTLGPPPYGPAQIQAQIRATEERGIHTWLLWNPGVVYKAEAIGR
ncbi:MAG: putative glycoside hydrolase [Desulfotomaculales bacterium]